jgi:hypothetical protein
MEFKTKGQQACYEKVATLLEKLFGELAIPRPQGPGWGISMGSSFTQVWIGTWGEDDALIQVRAYVVMGAEVTPDLMEFLLKENDKMIFGAFGLDNDKDIFFEHTILGSSCDKSTLKASVMSVINNADQYDDQIVSRWGGRRASDPAPAPSS